MIDSLDVDEEVPETGGGLNVRPPPAAGGKYVPP